MSSNKLTEDQRQMRAVLKARNFAKSYGIGAKWFSFTLDRVAKRYIPKGYEHMITVLDEWAAIGATSWAELEEHMKQVWIIDGEWSQYHHSIAQLKGWTLTQANGMWQVTATNPDKFNSDAEAQAHVLACEADPEHEEFTLAMVAINAIMVGNIRG